MKNPQAEVPGTGPTRPGAANFRATGSLEQVPPPLGSALRLPGCENWRQRNRIRNGCSNGTERSSSDVIRGTSGALILTLTEFPTGRITSTGYPIHHCRGLKPVVIICDSPATRKANPGGAFVYLLWRGGL